MAHNARASSPSPVCSRFHRAVELIGSRWTGAIIQTLLQGKTRYAFIKAAIPDITDRMLSERLRSLEAEDLLTRKVVPESPVRVEYELTTKGRSLHDALREISDWAERWIPLAANESRSSSDRAGTLRKTAVRRAQPARRA
jgi:DNA-binding HxlR family transcriptional regulator